MKKKIKVGPGGQRSLILQAQKRGEEKIIRRILEIQRRRRETMRSSKKK